MRAIIHWHLPTIFNVQRSAGSHRLMHTPHTYPSNFAHAAVVQSFSMARWKSAAFSRVSYAESAKGGGQRWLMTTEGAVVLSSNICKGALSVHLPVYQSKVIRWGCGGSNTATVPRKADYFPDLAPSPAVRYASPPLPAAIPLPRLPVPALECFCSILNRLIEQCSRERAACQSQLKTQKQKIKKAHG